MKKRVGGFLATFLTAAIAVSGIAATANAADAPADPASTITEPVTLTIHKHTTPAGEEGNGLETQVPEGAKPVEGVEFTLYKVPGVDLTTNAGWQAAARLSEEFKQNNDIDALFKDGGKDQAKVAAKATGADGTVVFAEADGVEVGLYLVEETDTAGAKVDGAATDVVPSRPFLVTLPMTHPTERDKWNYNVHVYPKNTPVKPVKTVADANTYAVGQDATYTVTTNVPQDRELTKYVVMDKFDPAHLEFKAVDSVKIGGVALAENTDYTVTDTDALVKVAFTAEGLKKLTATPNAQVVTTFVATVKAVQETDGTITNTAYVVPSDEYSEDPDNPGDKTPPVPSDPVYSKYAKIVIDKHNAAGAKLAGAEFQIYTCADYVGRENEATPLTVGGVQTFTTNEDGQAVIDGVRWSTFANGKEVAKGEDGYVEYCLVETKAPEGYEILSKPVVVVVDGDTVNAGAVGVDVENVKHNAGFKLPLTGSSAAILLCVCGTLLVVGGAVVLARKKTRA